MAGTQVDLIGLAVRHLAPTSPDTDPTALRARVWSEIGYLVDHPARTDSIDPAAWDAFIIACAEAGRTDPADVASELVDAKRRIAAGVKHGGGAVDDAIAGQAAAISTGHAPNPFVSNPPYRGLVVCVVEVAAGDPDDPWSPAMLAGYVERAIATQPHVRAVQVITAEDGGVIAFQDGHGGARLPWSNSPQPGADTGEVVDGQAHAINARIRPVDHDIDRVINVCGYCSAKIELLGETSSGGTQLWQHIESTPPDAAPHDATPANLASPPPADLADACERFHPGEDCLPGRNHPAANR